MSLIHIDKYGKGMNENENLHNTREVLDRFRIHTSNRNRSNTSLLIHTFIYLFETGQIHLLYREDIHSHPYLFYFYLYAIKH